MAFYFSPFPFVSILSFSFLALELSLLFLHSSLRSFNKKNALFLLSGWITYFSFFSIAFQVSVSVAFHPWLVILHIRLH